MPCIKCDDGKWKWGENGECSYDSEQACIDANEGEMKGWYLIKMAKEDDQDVAKILVYDEIGKNWFGEGVDAKEFVQDLHKLDVDRIDLHINSPGGNVFDGNAIYNALRVHKANVKVMIDGIAASAASVIAMSGDKIIMPENSMMMIHNPAGMVWGTAEQMIKMADTLEKVKIGVVASYKRKTGNKTDEIAEMMNDETWFTAKEAVDKGFADEVAEPSNVQNAFDIKLFNYKNLPDRFVQDREPIRFRQAYNPTKQLIRENEKTNNKGVNDVKITIDLLKKDHPEIVDELTKAGVDQGFKAGSEAEVERVRGIMKLTIAGHEDLVMEMAFDPSVSIEDAKSKLIKAVQEKAEQVINDQVLDAPDPVGVVDPVEGKEKEIDSNLPIEERCKLQWQKDKDLRDEFGGDFDSYLAYMIADAEGSIKILKTG